MWCFSFSVYECAVDEELKAEVIDHSPYTKYNSWNLFEGRRVRIFYIIALKSVLAISHYSAERV